MEIRKDVFFDKEVTVEVNPEDVLDEMSDEEIKSYYKDRFEENLSLSFSNDDLKDILSTIWQMPTKHGVRQRHHP